MPLLNFYGKFDHLVPPEACEQLTSAVGSKDVEDVCIDTGHIGIYVSSKAQKQFAPKIIRWLKDRDVEDVSHVPRQKAPTKRKSEANNQEPIVGSKGPLPGKKQAKPPRETDAPTGRQTAPRGKSLLIQKINEAI